MTKADKQKLAEELKGAFDGNLKWLDEMITRSGYVHPDKGLRQKDMSEVIQRKTLGRWEGEGLEVVKIKGAKFYPLLAFLKFVLDRSIRNANRKNSDELDKWKEKEAEFKAKERELKFQKQSGDYLPRDEVESVWMDHILTANKRLRSIPVSMATILRGEESPAVIEKTLRSEIDSALEELSE